MKIYGHVYLITRVDTGRSYVGSAVGKFDDRIDYWGSNDELYSEISLLGTELFKKTHLEDVYETVCSCPERGQYTRKRSNSRVNRQYLLMVEEIWQRKLGTIYPFGYNRCFACSLGTALQLKTPEERSEIARRREAMLTPEQRSERARKAMASMTPEARREKARKAHETQGPDGRKRRMRKAIETMGPDGLSARAIKIAENLGEDGRKARKAKADETLGPEGRKARVKKAMETMGPSGLSERARRANASLTPEQRSERSKRIWADKSAEERAMILKKVWETRRKNAALRKAQHDSSE
jgi:hypothetical protein